MIKMEHHNDRNDFDEKDVVRQNIMRQTPELYDKRRQGKLHYKRTLDDLPPQVISEDKEIYTQGVYQDIVIMPNKK